MNSSDSRHFPRKEFSNRITYEMSDGAGIEIVGAETENISSGGVCIIADKAPKSNRIIVIKIPINEVEIEVPSFTEVVWTEPATRTAGDTRVRIGLRFLK